MPHSWENGLSHLSFFPPQRQEYSLPKLLWSHFQISSEIRLEASSGFFLTLPTFSCWLSCRFTWLNGLLIPISCPVLGLLSVLQDCQNLFANLAYLLLQDSSPSPFFLLCIPFTAQPPSQASATTAQSLWNRGLSPVTRTFQRETIYSFLNQWRFKHQKSVSLLRGFQKLTDVLFNRILV